MLNIDGVDRFRLTGSDLEPVQSRLSQPEFTRAFTLLHAEPVSVPVSGDASAFLLVLSGNHAAIPSCFENSTCYAITLCRFTIDSYERLYPFLGLLHHQGRIPIEQQTARLAESLLDVLRQESHIMYTHAASHLLEALLFLIIARSQHETSNGSNIFVMRALRYMQANSTQTISLAALCKELGISQEHFIRVFKKELHISPIRYFNAMRIRKTVGMLLQGVSVQKIAYYMNFYNESHFSKMFKQYLGVTPRTYKLTRLESLRQQQIHSTPQLALTVSLLSDFVDAIPDFFFVKDLQFVTLICNHAYSHFVGKPKECICGKTDFDLFPQEDARFFRMADEQAFASGKSITFRRRVTYPDGHKLLIETTKSPYFDENGKMLGLVCVGRSLEDQSKHIFPTAE